MLVKGRSSDALAGGVDSPVRAGAAVGGDPFIQARGQGAYAYDPSGRRYVDYLMAYGPLLLGHAHPSVTRGLDEIAARGVVYGSTHEDELVLAERVREHVPSMERLRFTTTRTAAITASVPVVVKRKRSIEGTCSRMRSASNSSSSCVDPYTTPRAAISSSPRVTAGCACPSNSGPYANR
jgi:4-aminobutyrate aminotransferase-like enzyme